MSRAPNVHFMQLAIEQAEIAEGRTTPNPPVGAVITRDGYAVAKGYTHPPGGAHAEIDALHNWDGERPEDCALYVTLEPCCTTGRTPPCTDALIASKIRRVYVGTLDPSPEASGKGIEILRQHGIEVHVGTLQPECDHLIKPFRKHIQEGLPFVGVKWAMTLDGRIATKSGDSKWISSEQSRDFVHQLRNRFDTIMVGTGTLIADDPRLTTRIQDGRDAHRIILDTHLKGPASSTVYHLDSDARTWVFTSEKAVKEKSDLVETLSGGGNIEFIPSPLAADGYIDLQFALKEVESRGMNSILVEGGGSLIASLLEENLVDRIYTFIAPRIIGGKDALAPVLGLGVDQVADAIQLRPVETRAFGIDTLLVSDVIKAHKPS